MRFFLNDLNIILGGNSILQVQASQKIVVNKASYQVKIASKPERRNFRISSEQFESFFSKFRPLHGIVLT